MRCVRAKRAHGVRLTGNGRKARKRIKAQVAGHWSQVATLEKVGGRRRKLDCGNVRGKRIWVRGKWKGMALEKGRHGRRAAEGKRRKANGGRGKVVGEWRMANGEWQMANGEWRMANGEWRMAKGAN